MEEGEQGSGGKGRRVGAEGGGERVWKKRGGGRAAGKRGGGASPHLPHSLQTYLQVTGVTLSTHRVLTD